MRRELVGSYAHRRRHGDMTSAALDTVGGLAVTVAIADKHADETAEQVAHHFRRIASVQMSLENDTGALIATGTAYVIRHP